MKKVSKAGKKAAKRAKKGDQGATKPIVVFCSTMNEKERCAVVSHARASEYDVRKMLGGGGSMTAKLQKIVFRATGDVIVCTHWPCAAGVGLQELRAVLPQLRALNTEISIVGYFVYPDPTKGYRIVAEVVN